MKEGDERTPMFSRLRRETDHGDSGFTMVELVISMMILGIIMVILAAVQISALVSVTEARKLQQATAFANEAAEQMHAIPWNTLSKGMYSDFLSVSGGDPLVSGGVLDTDPEDAFNPTVPLKIATAGNDQNLTNPALPLFDEFGSHKQVRQDPSLAGVDFTIKAYVTDAMGGASSTSYGIAVVVEWPNSRGGTSRTTVWSEAYRGGAGGCGLQSLDTQPFLAACQAYFAASSSTGEITAEISATNYDPDPALIVAEPLMFPATASEYALGIRTAGTAASVESQQVSYVDGFVRYGGNTIMIGNPGTATQSGFAAFTLRATDDLTNQSGWLPTPSDLPVSQASSAETNMYLSNGGSPVQLRVRSDFARTGTIDASVAESCQTGIPAGQPCAMASLDNNSVLLDGSGYILMDLEGTTFRLTRRLSEGLSANNGNTDDAWAARFASAAGTGAVGCTTITGAGCVSAGATRTMATLNIGKVIGSPGTWDTQASEGMVKLEGSSSCPTSQNGYYGESVMVQRGAATGQNTIAPTVARCGQLRYWNGTGYTTVPISETTSTTIDTAPVTWTGSSYSISATTQVQILPRVITNPAPTDPACQTEACTVSVSAGTIVIVSIYHITGPSHQLVYIVATTVTSPSAQAAYKAP